MPEIKIAVIQYCPGPDRCANLTSAAALLAGAAGQGARLTVLPEMFAGVLPAEKWRDSAETAGGALEEFLSGEAARHGMYLIGGSYIENAGNGRYFNTSSVFGPDGGVIGRYRKMHLFWTDIPGVTAYDERSHLSAGERQLVFQAEGFAVAVGICYDLRFPEFFRMPAGRAVDLYCLPAAFMEATGRAHWEVLVRSRAIENLAYFAAAGTCGRHYELAGRPGSSVCTYGHSMIVSPWGEVLSQLAEGPGVAVASVSADVVAECRARLGALDHIREELWPGLS